MRTEFAFVIDHDIQVLITIPEFSLKFNYYYDTTEELHRFDETTVYLITRNDRVILAKDILCDTLEIFYRKLERAIKNDLSLPSYLKVGNVGEELNNMFNEQNNYNFSPFWLWSSLSHTQTLLYNYDNKIYLEIVPSCPDAYTDQSAEVINASFEKFMKTYKPIFFTEISLETAQEWLDQSKKIIKMINESSSKS